ncbi:hypothetical protein [uncultured Psychroserpens sp.]|uniref:hypothetical protein n=1 Tax=uncultured Psychroserpens sp. TaxID=255436 RepID=UPI0026380243|nr:hypothetical protein [uncultured Psychroserpens sp.]
MQKTNIRFKIFFPSGYIIEDYNNDNIDINVIFEDESVFHGTLFTLENINQLMIKNNDDFFWADDMVIVHNLKKTSIRKAVSMIIEDSVELILTKIGTTSEVYDDMNFENIKDMAH